jgi:hypothetical protein
MCFFLLLCVVAGERTLGIVIICVCLFLLFGVLAGKRALMFLVPGVLFFRLVLGVLFVCVRVCSCHSQKFFGITIIIFVAGEGALEVLKVFHNAIIFELCALGHPTFRIIMSYSSKH